MIRATCTTKLLDFAGVLEVEESMVSHLKVIQGDKSKGKSSSKVHQAAEELDYLITFKWSITQAMAGPCRTCFHQCAQPHTCLPGPLYGLSESQH